MVLRKHWVEMVASALVVLAAIAMFALLPFARGARPDVPVPHALAGQTRYSLDTATIGGVMTIMRWHPQPKLLLRRGEPAVFSGWAIDAAARAPASAVAAIVDGGRTFTAVTGIRRDDVAAALDDPALANVGFQVTIPGCALAPGAHRVAFQFLAADARGYYRSSDDIDISVQTRGGGPPHLAFAVDSITPELTTPGSHRLMGWLVDSSDCEPARSVNVRLDGRLAATASYGAPRPDVAQVLGVPAYAHSGFSARWSDASLSRGKHILRIDATLSDGAAVDAGYVRRFER